MSKTSNLAFPGIAATVLVVATIAFAGSMTGTGGQIGACDVNTRGKAVQWAAAHPGLNAATECNKANVS